MKGLAVCVRGSKAVEDRQDLQYIDQILALVRPFFRFSAYRKKL